METEARTHYRSLDLRSSVERRAMVAVGRSMKRAILTTALLLALPAGVAAQSAPDLEVAFAEVDDSTPVEGGRFKLWVTVGNFGDAESAATTLRYYQSTDATISSAGHAGRDGRGWGGGGKPDQPGVDSSDRAVDGGHVLLRGLCGRGGG